MVNRVEASGLEPHKEKFLDKVTAVLDGFPKTDKHAGFRTAARKGLSLILGASEVRLDRVENPYEGHQSERSIVVDFLTPETSSLRLTQKKDKVLIRVDYSEVDTYGEATLPKTVNIVTKYEGDLALAEWGQVDYSFLDKQTIFVKGLDLLVEEREGSLVVSDGSTEFSFPEHLNLYSELDQVHEDLKSFYKETNNNLY